MDTHLEAATAYVVFAIFAYAALKCSVPLLLGTAEQAAGAARNLLRRKP